MADADFSFVWEGASGDPWAHLRVARFTGHEALSLLYRYEIIVLARPDARPELADLVDRRCALRIATLSTPASKIVHGVIVEAEEIADHPEGRTYRLVVMPPWARARHRRSCRIFLDKTTRQIVEAVLTGDPRMQLHAGDAIEPDDGAADYQPALERFEWRIEDPSRLDSARVRPYCVQYNESDWALISRLLEEEGITYHYENGADTCLLVFSDRDHGRPRLEPVGIGAGVVGRHVSALHTGARVRPEKVVLGDYEWRKPRIAMGASAGKPRDLVEYVYPGGFIDRPQNGRALATAALERHRTEARFARGEGRLRVLSAGTIFRLENHKARLEGEYLVTSLEARGEQAGVIHSDASVTATEPFQVAFGCARRGAGAMVEESGFRPARVTPRPRIAGSQTAFVTAEPSAKGAEIHVGGPDGIDIGCVRLKFHWDTDQERLGKEPSSTWVRVSQAFAGAGQGGVWHPRVGVEVIVAFEEGDPDRPIVVGRVYNGTNRPHRGGAAPISTFKSYASPGGAVHNEITFDDSAGGELIYTNAGKDMTTDVGNDRAEKVASNASMNVGANDSEHVGANCTVMIGASDALSIGANDMTVVGANSTSAIGASSSSIVGASDTKIVGAAQSITIAATHTETVGGAVTETYGATRGTTVSAAEKQSIGANRTTTIGAALTQSFGALQTKLVGGDRFISCTSLTTTVGAAAIDLVGGSITTSVTGPQTSNVGAAMVYLAPSITYQNAQKGDLDTNRLELTGISINLGLMEGVAMGFGLAVTGLAVEATGLSMQAAGANMSVIGVQAKLDAVKLDTSGNKVRIGFILEI